MFDNHIILARVLVARGWSELRLPFLTQVHCATECHPRAGLKDGQPHLCQTRGIKVIIITLPRRN